VIAEHSEIKYILKIVIREPHHVTVLVRRLLVRDKLPNIE
jgi:hypothetical protein